MPRESLNLDDKDGCVCDLNITARLLCLRVFKNSSVLPLHFHLLQPAIRMSVGSDVELPVFLPPLKILARELVSDGE